MNYGTIDNPDGSQAVIITREGIKIKVDGQEPQPVDPEHESVKEIIAELNQENIQ